MIKWLLIVGLFTTNPVVIAGIDDEDVCWKLGELILAKRTDIAAVCMPYKALEDI